jgi:small GTP-binding protein
MDLMKTQSCPDIKIIVVGDTSVGKTSILSQFQSAAFNPSTESTIGAMFLAKQVTTSHGRVNLLMWDTAGQERYRALIPMYSRNADAALLVVDVSLYSSYESIDEWYELLKETCPSTVTVYVIANKIDLPLQIPVNKLQDWAVAHKCQCFRSCAKKYETVEPIFMKIAEDLGAKGKPTDITAPQEAPVERNCC